MLCIKTPSHYSIFVIIPEYYHSKKPKEDYLDSMLWIINQKAEGAFDNVYAEGIILDCKCRICSWEFKGEGLLP